MAYTLSNAIVDVYFELGQRNDHLATGGTTTTAIDANYTDDGDRVGTIIVTRDSAGAGAAPEGQFKRVSAYDASTGTFTTAAFSVAIASGDEFVYVNNKYPVYTIISAINRSLEELGYIDYVDVTNFTTASNQTEHALPVALKHAQPKRVQIQTDTDDANDNRWVEVMEWEVTPAAPGSTGLLIIPQYATGYDLKVWYETVHPSVRLYSDVISETIPPALLVAMAKVKALQWKRSRSTGRAYIEQLNAAKQELLNARILHKVYRHPKYSRLADHSRQDYLYTGEPDAVRVYFKW
jgi:hypothetical protein